MMNCKAYVLIFLLGYSLSGMGQNFKWRAPLQKVDSSGFYNIGLGPELVSKTASTDLADIRIYEKDKEIAWLLRKGTDSTDTIGRLNISHYSLIPYTVFKTREIKTSKQSVVEINFDKAYQIDKLRLTVDGFKFYRREAWLAKKNGDIRQKGNQDPYQLMDSFIILSGKTTIIELKGANRYKTLYLIIENEDNLPLTVKKIEAYQQNMHLTAYLEKDKTYILKTGAQDMSFPRYDLSYFNDSISNGVPFIKVGNFSQNKAEVKKATTFFNSKAWIWAALTALIGILGYLSYKMIREMQNKK
ncbi:hypothetical protein HDC92_002982 [Pedobacter sp. AK017]|uniref:hypothetical protein n=1 Tax=Pedobacter sp. AK017 TaxID=2723073 RepID=UPI00161A7045|nr:hypothetical protein [Pedobacter sp. AK017]MBB5439295.1 hypothetical protein [Pedobacter sp. AK017]